MTMLGLVFSVEIDISSTWPYLAMVNSVVVRGTKGCEGRGWSGRFSYGKMRGWVHS